MNSFRRTILLLVALGLLWSFNTSAISSSLINSTGSFDLSQNTEEEEDDAESKDLKFLSHSGNFFQFPKFSVAYKIQNSQTLLPNFSPIPTTPPDC